MPTKPYSPSVQIFSFVKIAEVRPNTLDGRSPGLSLAWQPLGQRLKRSRNKMIQVCQSGPAESSGHEDKPTPQRPAACPLGDLLGFDAEHPGRDQSL